MDSINNSAMPEAIYSAAQVAAFDRQLIDDFGVPGFTLMQRAASAAYVALMQRWPKAGRLCVFCGPGNNGGDGYLIARLALEGGWQVQLYSLVATKSLRGDAARARTAFEASGGEVEVFGDAPVDADVIVDALLGTGLSRDVEGSFAEAISRINNARAAGAGVLSVDVASGIDATTGRRWNVAVSADVTATFIGLKTGLLTGEGPGYCGEVVFNDLDAPRDLYADTEPTACRMMDDLQQRLLAPRMAHAHKGDHGRVLCMGGNRGFGGAIRMTAEAALRSGAGLVSVLCHSDHAGVMSQIRPELMCQGVIYQGEAADASVQARIDWASVLAVGPGLGKDHWGQSLFHQAMDSTLPLVVDADALNLLADASRPRGNWVLTPHPGEAARLLGKNTADINRDRIACALELARRYDAVVVLKGAGSLVATPSRLWLCAAGNPGMASGGMGDLLTGIIAGLIAQGLILADAATLGVWVHARAADEVARSQGQRGMLAMDLLPALIRQVNPEIA